MKDKKDVNKTAANTAKLKKTNIPEFVRTGIAI